MRSYEEAKKEMRPEEIVLTDLLREYRQVSNELDSACHLIDIELENINEHRDGVARSYLDKLADLESKMRLPMLDYQHTFVSSYGKINFRKGAVKRSWNLDALDAICNAKPEIKDTIWMFREEKTGEPSISIKLADAEAK